MCLNLCMCVSVQIRLFESVHVSMRGCVFVSEGRVCVSVQIRLFESVRLSMRGCVFVSEGRACVCVCVLWPQLARRNCHC